MAASNYTVIPTTLTDTIRHRAGEPDEERVTRLRLIADDLTGALDTAAQFVGCAGPVPVFWRMPAALPPSAAMDSGTREQDAARAAAVAAKTAPLLQPMPGTIAFKKIDSLLRGHSGVELAHCLRALPSLSHCIVAPAFPFQRRVTRGGRQYACTDNTWEIVGEDLEATLAAEGMAVRHARPGDPVPPGISLWDTESDADLQRIVAGAAGLDSVLWCGSSGLAGAIAGSHPPRTDPLARPVLGLFGSDHPVTLRQLDAADEHRLVLPDGGAASAHLLTRRLAASGVALVGFALPPGLARHDAAGRIARQMTALLDHVAPPRTLCLALGAAQLDVQGQIKPGVPSAVMRGGRWDGIDIVSKSGAFGDAALLGRLLDMKPERTCA